MKNAQSVNDFIMSRTLEKNELVKMIGGQNFGSLGNQNPYAPSTYPGGAGGQGHNAGYPGGHPGGYPGAGYGMPPAQPGFQAYPGYQSRPSYPPYGQ